MIRAPSVSITSSLGAISSTNSMVYSIPAHPPFLRPMRRPWWLSFSINLIICRAAAVVKVTACLPGMPNIVDPLRYSLNLSI